MSEAFSATQKDAGLIDAEIEYLKARGATSEKILMRMGKTEEECDERVVEIFLEGKQIGDRLHKASRSPTIVRAVLLVAYDGAREACGPKKAEHKDPS